MSLVTPIMLDLSLPNDYVTVTARQNDTDRFIRCRLTNYGVPFTVHTNDQVTIECTRKDGEQMAFLGNVEDNGEVLLPINPWMLAFNGIAFCSVVVNSFGATFGTPSFKLKIEHSNIEENPEYPTPVPPTPQGGGWTKEQTYLLKTFADAFDEMSRHLVYLDESGVPGYEYAQEGYKALKNLCLSLLGIVNEYVSAENELSFTKIFPDTCRYSEDGSVFIY